MQGVWKVKYVATGMLIALSLYMTTMYRTTSWKGLDADQDDTIFKKLANRLYFTAMAQSSVGLGDMVPKTIFGRLITTAHLLFIVFIAII